MPNNWEKVALINPYFSLMKRLYHLTPNPRIAERLGALWLLYPRDWIDNRILIRRDFETKQIDCAIKYIADYKLTVFYDCGANIGLYSVLLGLEAKGLEAIHAFEPVSQTWVRLVTNLGLNNLMEKACAHQYGLGDVSETLMIAIDRNSSGTATLCETEKGNPKRHYAEQQRVEIKPFDLEFEQKDERAFFKIDLEGHEAQALVGMEKYLRNNICLLQIELWPRNEEAVAKWLVGRGYRLIDCIGSDNYFTNDNLKV